MSNETEKCWLIQSGSEPAGPYSQAQLRSLARSGRISRSTLIQDLNSSNWLVAGQLPELFQQVVPTTKVADQAKPTQPQATPIRPALPASPAPTSMSPPVPSGFGDKKYFASTHPAIIAAAAAGAVGSAVIGILLFFSLQYAAAKRSGLVEPDLDVATVAPKTSASTGNADSLAGAAPNHSAVYSTEDLVSRTQQSVAAVITNQGSGSGFMVGPSVMATNYHVIANSPSNEITVVFPDGEETKQGPFQAMIIAEQPDRDLALLRIEAEIPTLDVYPDYRFRRGQDIIIIGTPGYARRGLLPNAVTRGVLSSQAELYGFEHFQVSLAVNSGNSGGPVLGMDGRVIGVVVSKSLTEESIGFCIPAPDLETLIKSQESSNFFPTANAAALHDARRLIRAIVDQILMRDITMAESISLIGMDLSTVSAGRFVQELKRMSKDESPDLFKSYQSELDSLSHDLLLSADVRRAISGIRRRHVAIESLLQSPTGDVERFVNQLDSLDNDFFDNLADVNNILEIGRPELLSK